MVAPAKTATAPTQTRTNGAAPHPQYDREYDPAYLRVAYPPNEEPMVDAARLMTYFLDMIWPIVELFGKIPNVFINSDVFIYHRVGGATVTVAPDLMIAFDVDVQSIMDSGSYHTWMVGKPPEFVMEVGSDSTFNRDLDEKPAIYAEMGVRQYWLFDPPDGSRYGFILKGLRLVNGRYEEIPMTEGPGDSARGHCEVLGLDICWENGTLRFYNPATGEYLKNQDETIAALAAAVAERDAAQTERDAAQAERDAAQAENRRLLALLAERDQ